LTKKDDVVYIVYSPISGLKEDNMALREIIRETRTSAAVISISGMYGRILLFKRTYEVMRDKMGQDFGYVRLFVDDKVKGKFWMKPSLDGGVPIRLTGKNRILSAVPLLAALGWKRTDTVRLPVVWDVRHKAYAVDVKARMIEKPEKTDAAPEEC
jgi:hypothetical protein